MFNNVCMLHGTLWYEQCDPIALRMGKKLQVFVVPVLLFCEEEGRKGAKCWVSGVKGLLGRELKSVEDIPGMGWLPGVYGSDPS